MGYLILIILIILLISLLYYFSDDQPIESFKLSTEKRVRFKSEIDDDILVNNDILGSNDTLFEDYFNTDPPTPSNIASDSAFLDLYQTDLNMSYGLPLVSELAKKAYHQEIQAGNQNYIDAINNFRDYQLDESNVIKPEKIDPFQHPELFKGKAIKDIFNKMVENVKPVPKTMIGEQNGMMVYANELPMNGGELMTNGLTGNDNSIYYSQANYGDAF
jgi:hypothetical protein